MCTLYSLHAAATHHKQVYKAGTHMQYPWKNSSGSFNGRMLGSSQMGTPQLPGPLPVAGPTASFRALHMRPCSGKNPSMVTQRMVIAIWWPAPSLEVGVGGVVVHSWAEDAAQRARSRQHLALVERHLVLVVSIAPAGYSLASVGDMQRYLLTCVLITTDVAISEAGI